MRRGTPGLTHPCSAAPGGGAGTQDDVWAVLTVLWEMAANVHAQHALFLQYMRLHRWAAPHRAENREIFALAPDMHCATGAGLSSEAGRPLLQAGLPKLPPSAGCEGAN